MLTRSPRRAAASVRRTLCAMTLVAAIGVGAAGCGDDDNGSGPGSVAGTYTLRTVNGQSLPFNFGLGFALESGYVDLEEDGEFELSLDFSDDDFDELVFGEWERDGNEITFVSDDGESLTATLSGNTITYSERGFTLLFRK